ncbi:MAG: hypothetical protein QXE01_03860 [Sulfolobales archaeon]
MDINLLDDALKLKILSRVVKVVDGGVELSKLILSNAMHELLKL